MKKNALNFFAGLLTIFVVSQTMAQETSCPKPQPTVDTAFSIIEQPSGRSLQRYLSENVIAKTAQNEKCETMYLAAIRAQNEVARRDLDAIGFGPRTADEINERVSIIPSEKANKVVVNMYEVALRYGTVKAVTDLRKRGGQLMGHNREAGATEIHVAAYSNTKEVIAELVRAGVDITKKTDKGDTVLHIAAIKNTKIVVEALIKAGIDINAKDDKGFTALHVASERNKKDVIEVLIKAGADINAKQVNGLTPLFQAIQHNSLDTIQLLISAGADLKIKDKENNNLLMAAATTNKKEVVEYLIQSGIDVNERGHKNNTALLFAVVYGSPSVVEALLNAGAQVNLVNDAGETALVAAVKYASANKLLLRLTKKNIELLLAAGADKSQKAKDGRTAYDIAIQAQLDQDIQDLLKP